MDKKIWIVGSSSGIGLELVKLFLLNDFVVIASSRNATSTEELKDLKTKYESKLYLVDIDVSSEISVKKCVESVYDIAKNINICFYNAGVYEVSKVDKINIHDFESMININYLGAIRVLKYFLENKEKNYKSKVVFNASLSSYFGLPYGGAYSSSKAALVNYAQSIQPELKLQNIDLQIINHGFVKTRLTSKNDFQMPQLIESKTAANIIFNKLKEPYYFEICFPFLLSKFLKIISLLPYSLSFKITKNFLKPNSNS